MGATAAIISAISGVGALALTGIGMGMQYKAQRQAAAQQAALARYNYAIEAQNIRQQTAMAQWQANAQAKQMEANAGMANANAQANANLMKTNAEANAQAMETASKANISRGVEDVRRTREEQLRFQAIQRARQAKSGVAAAGTPVEVLAETARNMQLAVNDSWYETNVESSRLEHAAAVERWQGDRAAQMELFGGAGQAANMQMQAGIARAEGALAPIRARMAMRKNQFELQAGLNSAGGMKQAATAGLVAGAGSLLSQGASLYNSGAFKPQGKTFTMYGGGGSVGTGFVKL